jgi:hypothetical protein
MQVIASIPTLPAVGTGPRHAAVGTGAVPEPTAVRLPPRARQLEGRSGPPFPARSVCVLALAAAGCWAAVGWADRMRLAQVPQGDQQAVQQAVSPSPRLAALPESAP